MRWWLRADADAYNTGTTDATDGQTVATWNDQSAINNDAINATAGTRPIFRTNIVNTYPALEFDGTKFLDASAAPGIGNTESFHIFMVFKLNSYQTNGGTQDGTGTFIMDRRDITDELTSLKIVNTDKYFYQRREAAGGANLGGPVSATSVNTANFVIVDYFRRNNASVFTEGIYLNGALDVSQTGPSGNIPGPLLKIGRHCTDANGGINGYITEVALYDAELISTNSRQRVESYLALKYGITLSSSLDYLRASGAVIYPSTTAGYSGYVTDIAGFGQDNNSGLNQEESASQNPGNMLRIHSATSVNDGDFMVWGHNNGSITSGSSSVDGVTIRRRLARVWRVKETNGVGDITVAFDLTNVPGAKVQADLRMLIDRDGDGFADNDRTPLTGTLAGNIFTVTVVAANLNDGDYFTVGTTNTTTTPLPIELADFKVSYEAPQVVASWKTTSELNNDYFTLERAGEDLSFNEVARKPGAGTTKEPRNYTAVDPYPFEGKSYYRLKQTDYDGTFTYSAPSFIFIENSDKKLSIFPNPNEGNFLNVRFGNAPFQLTEVEIFNQQGSSLEKHIVTGAQLSEYKVELNRRLSPGLYLLRVRYNGKQEFSKVLVQPAN